MLNMDAAQQPSADSVSVLPPQAEHNLRAVVYLVIAATLISGLFTGFLSSLTYISGVVVVFCLAWPKSAQVLLSHVPAQNLRLMKLALLLFDAFMIGIVLALVQLSPIVSMLLLTMANAMFIANSRLIIYLSSLVITLLGLVVCNLVLLPSLPWGNMAPLTVIFTCGIGVAVYVATSAFFINRQAQQINSARHALEQRKNQYLELTRKLAKYISPQVWQTIFSGKKDVKLETQRKKLTVFFSDIQGFTHLSEIMEADALTELLNTYLTDMSLIALKHGGTIDKFIGDSVMVFFGDPESQGTKKDAEACVAMALEMRRHMKVLRQKWHSQGVPQPLEIRMGIHTGYCTVGNFGAASRMDYTIIGKDVNLASRLESNAHAGEILVSLETYTLINDTVLCRAKGKINAKGFSQPVPIFQVVDFRRELGSRPSFSEYECEGFSMHIDLEKVRNYDIDRIVDALDKTRRSIDNQLLS